MSAKKVEVKPNTVRDKLIRDFSFQVETAKKNLRLFAEGVEKDPSYAFIWADQHFKYAADLSVGQQVIMCLQHYHDVKDIRMVLLDNIKNKARYINNKSTSTCSNFFNECMLAAATEAYDKLSWAVDLEKEYFKK